MKTLKDALVTYRQTPHVATGIPPANFIFRDGIKTQFPRKSAKETEIEMARKKDKAIKEERQDSINASKFRKDTEINTGDVVIARNFAKTSKFEPIFLPEPFVVVGCENSANRLVLENMSDSRLVLRHVDDVKVCPPALFQKHREPCNECETGEVLITRNTELEELEESLNNQSEPRRTTRKNAGIPPVRYPNN